MATKRKKLRTLRHWKQQFNENSDFMFRRHSLLWGVEYQRGDDIPDELRTHKFKLKRFWEAKRIEIVEYEEVEEPEDPEKQEPDKEQEAITG